MAPSSNEASDRCFCPDPRTIDEDLSMSTLFWIFVVHVSWLSFLFVVVVVVVAAAAVAAIEQSLHTISDVVPLNLSHSNSLWSRF